MWFVCETKDDCARSQMFPSVSPTSYHNSVFHFLVQFRNTIGRLCWLLCAVRQWCVQCLVKQAIDYAIWKKFPQVEGKKIAWFPYQHRQYWCGNSPRCAIVFWQWEVCPPSEYNDHCWRLQPPVMIAEEKPDRLVVLKSVDGLTSVEPACP